MRKAVHYFLVVCVSLFNLPAPQLAAENPENVEATQAGAPSMAESEQVINIPYFSLRDGMDSILTLNNNMAEEMPVTVTIHNGKGKGLLLSPITVGGFSYTDVSLAEQLRDAGEEFRSGNVEIKYHGIPMGLTCKVSIFSMRKRVSFEAHVHETMDFESTTMNGIVRLPGDEAEAFLALTNTAMSPVTVQLTVGSKTKSYSLNSRETVVVKLNDDLKANPTQATLIRLQHNGNPGDIIQTGFVLDLQNGYTAGIAFFDPAIMRSNKLAGAHFRFGLPDPGEGFPEGTQFRAPLLLGNVSGQPVSAHVAVDYTDQGTVNILAIKDLGLAPGGVQQVDLAEELAQLGVTGPVESAGVEVTYDGAPGSVIAQLTSVDQSGDYSFETPFKDPAAVNETAGGSYPWSLEDGANTVIHLKNTTSQRAFALIKLWLPDGQLYNPDRVFLDPFQTVSIDIRKMKEANKLDVRGQAFPPEAVQGQFWWSMSKAHALIGRAELVNVSGGIARSFSCGVPCSCPDNVDLYYMQPASGSYALGYTGTPFTAKVIFENCTGYQTGPYTSYVDDWWSSNSNVASVNGSGQVTANAPGTAYIYTGTWYDYNWYDAEWGCDVDLDYYVAAAQAQVRQPWQVRVLATVDEGSEYCGGHGWKRTVYEQLQYQDGSPVAYAGIAMEEIVNLGTPNELGLSDPVQTGSASTDSNGGFLDIFFACSSQCPGSGETRALQSFTYNGNGLPHSNLIVYKCDSITSDGY